MKKTLLFLSLIASLTLNAQWSSRGTGFDVQYRGLSEIHMVNSSVIWALAYDGSGGGANVQEMTISLDGGETWEAKQINIGNTALEINNICPVSATTAWISAIVNVPTGGDQSQNGVGYIFKTTNGGQDWVPQCEQGFQVAGTSFLNGVYFFNENVGVAFGDPLNGEFEIWRTTNGGTDWALVDANSIANPLSGEYGYNSVPTAAGGTLWLTTNKGRLLRTTDMGATFTGNGISGLSDFSGINPTTGNGTMGNVIFSNANSGFLLKTVIAGSTTNHTYTRTFYTTSNGGTSWSPTATNFTGTRFILTYIPNTTRIVATSLAAPIGTSISLDNGTSWQVVETAEQRGFAAFLDNTTGFCGGFSSDDPFGTIGIYKLTSPLGVDNNAIAKFKVYPNPANSVVTISTPDVESAKLAVTDLTGKVVLTKSLSGIENTVDISALATGAYFFEVSADSKKEVIKILKN